LFSRLAPSFEGSLEEPPFLECGGLAAAFTAVTPGSSFGTDETRICETAPKLASEEAFCFY